MLKKIILFCLIIGSLILAIPAHSESYIKPKIEPTIDKKLITDYTSFYAKKYGISQNLLNKVIACESTFNPKAIHYHDGGKGKHSIGVLQFQESTFLLWEKKLGEDLNYDSTHDQIKLASYMWSKGQARQWTCYRNLV